MRLWKTRTSFLYGNCNRGRHGQREVARMKQEITEDRRLSVTPFQSNGCHSERPLLARGICGLAAPNNATFFPFARPRIGMTAGLVGDGVLHLSIASGKNERSSTTRTCACAKNISVFVRQAQQGAAAAQLAWPLNSPVVKLERPSPAPEGAFITQHLRHA